MKIETFYTGGGIWLSQTDIDAFHYAVVTSEHPDFLSVYRKPEEEDEMYYPEDMVFCKVYHDLNPEQKELYTQLKSGLERNGAL